MKSLAAFVVILVTGLFVWLASFSYGKYGPGWDKSDGYSQSQVEAMSEFVAVNLPPSPSKMVYIWRDKKAAALASVYNLTPENLDSTVDVRRMR